MDDELADLRSRVELSTDEAVVDEHSRDASRATPGGRPAAVAFPTDAAQVAAALTWASAHGIRVSVRGGGTGLSGGAVGYAGGLVISTSRLTRLDIDPVNMVATVGPGVITADLDRAAAAHGLMYAPDPVSSQTSSVGGNIATNAGGPRCLAYGVTKDVVSALEVVLADGRIIHTGSRTVKNSTGFDVKSLFIGSEGTLGVITEAVVRLRRRPLGPPVAFAASFGGLADAGNAIIGILSRCEVPQSLELMDRNTLDLVAEFYPDEPTPDGQAVLVGEYVGLHARESAEELQAVCREHRATTMGGEAAAALLRTRTRVNPALSASGLGMSCDVAVPIGRLPEMLAEIERISRDLGMRVNTFAHAGDGNLHPAVVVPVGDPAAVPRAEKILDAITEAGIALGGVISGEHGIGSLKLKHFDSQFDEPTRSVQRQVKELFDPRGVLTPGRAL